MLTSWFIPLSRLTIYLKANLNSEFSFSLTGCLTKAKEHCLPNYFKASFNKEFSFLLTGCYTKTKGPSLFYSKACLTLDFSFFYAGCLTKVKSLGFPNDFKADLDSVFSFSQTGCLAKDKIYSLIYIYIYIYMEINNGNKFDSMKKIEKQSIPKVINLWW